MILGTLIAIGLVLLTRRWSTAKPETRRYRGRVILTRVDADD
jgi:hypothetical protein